MVDYYSRAEKSEAPRCGEHRDFGTFTLIFQDEVGGLEMQTPDGSWRPIPVGKGAVLLFGWCTKIRSNDRMPATLHRVNNALPIHADGQNVIPRRTSAILFVAPEPDTLLTPVAVSADEKLHYRTVKAFELKGQMGRKWKWREGTLAATDAILEEAEMRLFPSQDAIVAHEVGVL